MNLGLTIYEVEAYLFILEYDSAEASELSRKSDNPYVKIYETLKKLESYCFLEVQQTRPKKFRSREANVAIEDFLTNKRQILDNEYAEYKHLGNKFLDEIKNLDQYTRKEQTFWRTAISTDMFDCISQV